MKNVPNYIFVLKYMTSQNLHVKLTNNMNNSCFQNVGGKHVGGKQRL